MRYYRANITGLVAATLKGHLVASPAVLPGSLNGTEDVASLKVFVCLSCRTLTQPKYWKAQVCGLTDINQGYRNKQSVITGTAESQQAEVMLLTYPARCLLSV